MIFKIYSNVSAVQDYSFITTCRALVENLRREEMAASHHVAANNYPQPAPLDQHEQQTTRKTTIGWVMSGWNNTVLDSVRLLEEEDQLQQLQQLQQHQQQQQQLQNPPRQPHLPSPQPTPHPPAGYGEDTTEVPPSIATIPTVSISSISSVSTTTNDDDDDDSSEKPYQLLTIGGLGDGDNAMVKRASI